MTVGACLLWASGVMPGCSASSSDSPAEPLLECAVEGRVEACFTGALAARGTGACHDGIHQCVDGAWTDCADEVTPAPTESCDDGLDDDCDGVVDDGCACGGFDSHPCYGGSAETRDVGICRSGTQQCVGGSWSIECAGQILPDASETCGNGLDDDCNGESDDGCGGNDGGAG